MSMIQSARVASYWIHPPNEVSISWLFNTQQASTILIIKGDRPKRQWVSSKFPKSVFSGSTQAIPRQPTQSSCSPRPVVFNRRHGCGHSGCDDPKWLRRLAAATPSLSRRQRCPRQISWVLFWQLKNIKALLLSDLEQPFLFISTQKRCR